MAIDTIPYGSYSLLVSKPHRKGAEEARTQLPRLLANAEKGQATIITRHGRNIAALVPMTALPGTKQLALSPLAGSGKGMWGRDGTRAVRKLRDEWNR